MLADYKSTRTGGKVIYSHLFLFDQIIYIYNMKHDSLKRSLRLSTALLLAAGNAFPVLAEQPERTPHAAMFLTAWPKADRSVPFLFAGEGREFRVLWGMDTAWDSEGNVRCGTNHIGKACMGTGRISFQPNDLVTSSGELTNAQKSALQSRLDHIALSGVKDVLLNCDHEALNDRDGLAHYRGKPQEWYKVIKASVSYARSKGFNVTSIAPFNEPDYGPWNEGSKDDFKEICRLISQDSDLAGIRLSAGNTLNCDAALEWYNYMKPYVSEGNTHQLAGSFDSYANFFTTVRRDGNHATADELHNVMEAIVGVEYGMQSGIWWGFDGVARGEFCQANVEGGARLGYAENRDAWSAASVYRLPDGRVKAFLGTSERQAHTSSYEFVCKDRDVYYDGFGPVRCYQMEMPGGGGYQDGQTNAERVVHITSGEDVPPFQLTEGDYVIMNKKTRFAMSITGGSTDNGAGICQYSYPGSNSRPYQQWRIAPVSPRIGGDFSYFFIRSTRNTDMLLDVVSWSSTSGGSICAYAGGAGTNEQWYFEYAGDGDYYIRSRFSGLYLEVTNGSMQSGTAIRQADFNGKPQQRWRLIPVDAQRELVPPAVPAGLQAKAQSASIRLSWEEVADDDCDGYMVLQGEEQADGSVLWNVIGRKIQGPAFIDNSCVSGRSYRYKVRSIDRCSNMSECSEEVAAQTKPRPAVVAQYEFDKSLFDLSANQMDAVSSGKLSYVGSQKKSGGQSLFLNGTDAFLKLPPAVSSSRQMTVTTWVRWSGGDIWQRIFDFGNDTNQYFLLTPSNGDDMRFIIKNGGGEQVLPTGKKLPTAKWCHVAVAIGDDGIRIYLDGEEVAASGSITIRPSDILPARCYLGRSQYDADPYLKGFIDDFRIYNYALTADEVVKVMQDAADGLGNIPADTASPVVETEYYSVEGKQLPAPSKGITIARQRHANGKQTVKKTAKSSL